ncbi:MAG: glycosyltransferase [Sandaracinaceae bacterium]|nr:glycosyltransferase [Sandaracinaceae bacterium]
MTLLITRFALGGAETQAVRVAARLARRGWEVELAALFGGDAFARELSAAGVTARSLRSAAGVASFVRRTRARRPQALVAFLYHPTLFAAAVGRLLGVPVISSIRDPIFGKHRRLSVVRALMRHGLVDRLVANSSEVAHKLVKKDRFPRAQVEHVPNAIDIALVDSDVGAREHVRASLGLAAEHFVWLAVGNYVQPEKDYPTLISAFERVAARRSDARLMTCGRGTMSASLLARIDTLGGRVKVLGERNDVPALLAACDAFVLSSSTEGMPNAVLEALAAGRPVVSTRVGAVPEMIEDAVTGVLCAPRDPEMLSEKMLVMMAMDAGGRERLGRAARASVEARYSVDAIVDRWERLIGGAEER